MLDQSADAQPGHVYLVGAGPGDPALLTLRAAHLLKTCDVILPDDLVSDEILELASPTTLIIPVGKRCGQPRITQSGIHDLMLEHSRNGSSVVRLKSGDPLIFGRAAEEIGFLSEHAIPCEIVPGITAAFAVAAALKTPLTDRTRASKLVLATAHHAHGKVSLTPSWSGAFPDEATLVIYMPGRDFETLAQDLIASGIQPTTPCTAISSASTPQQHIHTSTLAELRSEHVGPAPVILLVGPAIANSAAEPAR
jgi:uroporphyrin-III C-methyltransferase